MSSQSCFYQEGCDGVQVVDVFWMQEIKETEVSSVRTSLWLKQSCKWLRKKELWGGGGTSLGGSVRLRISFWAC